MKTNLFKIVVERTRLLALLALLVVSTTTAWGATVNYSWTLAAGDLNTVQPVKTITVGSPATTWEASFTWSSSPYFNDAQLQIGSEGNPCTNLTLTAPNFGGTITNITVNAKMASSGGAKISMSVGGSSVKSATNLTTSYADYSTGTISKSGAVQITITNTAKAFYIKSIAVTCSGTIYTINWSVNEGACSGSPSTSVMEGGQVGTLPTTPTTSDCDDIKQFVGWSASPIVGSTDDKPADLFKYPKDAPTVTGNVTYYAVFATADVAPEDETLFEITSYSSIPTGWGNSGISTGTYFSFNSNGAMISPLYDPHNDVELTTRVATLNSGTNHCLVVYLLDEDDNVKYTRYTATPTSSTYIDGGTMNFGDIPYSFKIKFYLPTAGKGVRLQQPTLTGSTLGEFSGYVTTCVSCATNVTLSKSETGSGAVAFSPTGPIATCSATAADRQTTMTITPTAGYTLSAFNYSTGTGAISPTNQSPGAPSTSQNSATPQSITLTFAKDADGTCTANATFSEMKVTSWTWTKGGGEIPATVDVYVGQKIQLDVSMSPSGVLTSHKNNTSYTYDVNSTYIGNPTRAGAYFTFEGKAAVASTTITLTHNDDTSTPKAFAQTVNVSVKALPSVTFTDIVHDETFGAVTATVSVDKLTVTTTKKTPTHADVDDPGDSYNSCERQHLHLVGWIDKDWADDNPDATHAEIVAATAYFYAPNADIDLVAKNGKTYLAVWAKEVVMP